MDILRYATQLQLPGFDARHQEALSRADVLLVGCGGLGVPAITYLAAAGVGRLLLCDDDVVEPANLNRQFIYCDSDLGAPKAEAAARWVCAQNPQVSCVAWPRRLTAQLFAQLASEIDLVLCCVDNMETRFLLNDLCLRAQVPLINAGVREWCGEVLCISAPAGVCLRCAYPVAAYPVQRHGVLGAVTGVVGSLQALLAVDYLTGRPIPWGQLLLVDLEHWEMRRIEVKKKAGCAHP